MSSTINALTSGGGIAIAGDTSGQLQLQTNNGTTAVTIDTSQNVGIGVTPSSWNTYANNIETPTGAVVSYSPSSNLGIVQNAYYNSGWKYKTSNYASFYLQSSGVHSWSYASSGTAGNAVTFNEAMRIDSSGNLLVGTTTNTSSSRLKIDWTSGNYGFYSKTSADTLSYHLVFGNATYASAGNISTTNNTTAYGTTSDYRAKDNIKPMLGALNTVSKLKPVTYNWKNTNITGQGFIAHELQEFVTDAVVGKKDATDADGNPIYQSIDTSFLVATLTAAIQELNAKVEAQAATITALQAKVGV